MTTEDDRKVSSGLRLDDAPPEADSAGSFDLPGDDDFGMDADLDGALDDELEDGLAAPPPPRRARGGRRRLLLAVMLLVILLGGGAFAYMWMDKAGGPSPLAVVPPDVPAPGAMPLPGEAPMMAGVMTIDEGVLQEIAPPQMAEIPSIGESGLPPVAPPMPESAAVELEDGIVPGEGAGMVPPPMDEALPGMAAALPMPDAPLFPPEVAVPDLPEEAVAELPVVPAEEETAFQPEESEFSQAMDEETAESGMPMAVQASGDIKTLLSDIMSLNAMTSNELRRSIQALEQKVTALESEVRARADSPVQAAPAASEVTRADLDALRRQIERLAAAPAPAAPPVSAAAAPAAAPPAETPRRVTPPSRPKVAAPKPEAVPQPPPEALRTRPILRPPSTVGVQTAVPVPSADVAVARWDLRAAQPGQAWLADKASGEMRRVVLGDDVPDLGRVLSVSVESGRWVVRGTRGFVAQ